MNNFVELLPYAIVVKNGIESPAEVLEEVLQRGLGESWNDGYDHSLPGSELSIFDDLADRNASFHDTDTLFNLYENLRTLFVDYIEHFGLRSQLVEPVYTGNYSMKEYPVGSSLGIHRDYGAFSMFNQEIPCSITINAYLNDDYEGGEITFYDNTLPHDHPGSGIEPLLLYKPEPGDAVIFPSIMLHSVMEITSGTRYGLNISAKESAQPTWFNFIANI